MRTRGRTFTKRVKYDPECIDVAMAYAAGFGYFLAAYGFEGSELVLHFEEVTK